MTKHLLTLATTLTLTISTFPPPPTTNIPSLYPNIAETSHASPEAIDLFLAYFTAKSSADGGGEVYLFHPKEASYYDSTLGLTIAANRSQLDTIVKPLIESLAETAPNDRSYPLRILGDTSGGAIVYFVDTPGFFGAEIRALAAVDFLDGKVRRQVDNWDGRGSPVKGILGADDVFPSEMGLGLVEELAAEEMKEMAKRINEAFSEGDVEAAKELFDYNAVFEDLTLRTRIEGQIEITRYLQRALKRLPYGPGTEITHVVGSAVGGGFEWRPSGDGVKYGITALELNGGGNITRFTTVWDGSLVNETFIRELAVLAPTP